jgi:hypothetical protein
MKPMKPAALRNRSKEEIMLTEKQYQEAFNMALEAFKSDPQAWQSEDLNPYSPGSDEYRAWNDGWLYASNFHTLKSNADAHRGQVERGETVRPSDLQ